MVTLPEPIVLHASALEAAQGFPSRRPSALALWHLLSLDAPTVALVWTWFVGRCFHVKVGWPVLIAMFLAVWILYACDRLLDASAAADDGDPRLPVLERRHYFHALHRRSFLGAIFVAAGALLLCIARFGLAELVVYLLLGAALSLWLGLVHGLAAARSLRLPKELAVGLYFPLAVCIPTLVRMSSPRMELVAPVAMLALLCTTNGLFIRRWEVQASAGETRSRTAQADPLTRMLLRRLPIIALACCLLPLLFAARRASLGGATPAEVAVTLSAAGLLLLHRVRRSIETTHLRALADLVLLSPLMLAPFLR